MVKHVLESSITFKGVCKEASAAAVKITASSSKWYKILRDDFVEPHYGKKAANAVCTIGDTRWNSTQACFASQLRIRSACRAFVTRHKNVTCFPKELLVWEEMAFWFRLEEAELLIRPFCDASFLMQRNCNTMAHVMLVLLNLYSHISDFCGDSSDEQEDVLKDIEKRWKKQEQPLFIIAFALHPMYRNTVVELLKKSQEKDGVWGESLNLFCISRLVEAAKFYYTKHELFLSTTPEAREKEMDNLGRYFKAWLRGTPLVMDIYKPTQNEVEYWDDQKESYPPLANFATFVLDADVHSSNCERVFKEFARQHTKARNRLHPSTVDKLAQVKYHVRRKYPDDYAAGSKEQIDFSSGA
jgi:hypothetical protein